MCWWQVNENSPHYKENIWQVCQHLSKSSQGVTKLYVDLPCLGKQKVFFGNWFSQYDLLYLKTEGILSVGTIRGNRSQGCPLESSRTLSKASLWDYQCNANSALVVVEWVDNGVVVLVSGFANIEPVGSIVYCCRTHKTKKEIPCLEIVSEHNKSMGVAGLTNMFLAKCCISWKTKKRYQKIFWNLTDIAKVNF